MDIKKVNKNILIDKFSLQKINIRVLMVTKQIYLSAKSNNLTYVHKLQKYIINCNEAKILFIHRFCYQISSYYNSCNAIDRLMLNINMFDLLKSLFSKSLSKFSLKNLIRDYIKQSLIHLSIKPTYTARTVHDLIKLINQKLLYQLFNTCINTKINILLNKTIVKKITCCNHVNKSINQWLNNGMCLNFVKVYDLKYRKLFTKQKDCQIRSKLETLNNLIILISKILYNDRYWYIFNFMRKEQQYFKITDTILLIEAKKIGTKSTISKTFKLLVNRIFYRNNRFGFKSINLFKTYTKLVNEIKSTYQYHLYDINTFISIPLTKICNNILNNILYVWLKRKIFTTTHTFHVIYSLKQVNNILNKFIYLYNLKNYSDIHLSQLVKT
uniref:Reverse transcriptase N-terminal domain-containing protein n=1 Tax=Pleurostichidium falkenbergii TaxID=121064 RepID=A0A4D6UYB7_9FLOR|nr:hypothetical protein [Pleurostichidium falkenbergii]QCH39638.1 hypothetical protein [Pleurostichidium falkenbergii]